MSLVVLGADPPISAAELALVEHIQDVSPRPVFVLNKADRIQRASINSWGTG